MTNQTLPDLSGFTGSETFYRHGLNRRLVFTDGVKYLADQVGAYWLIDDIAVYQLDRKIAATEFQVWKLAVVGSNAILKCEDGNSNRVFTKKISLTDFPEPGITLWFVNNTLLLPSEY